MSVILSEKLDYNFHKLIVKQNLGFLCGYIGIPCEHPLYKIEYYQCIQGCKREQRIYFETDKFIWICRYELDHKAPEDLFKCHGGLTYSGNDLIAANADLWYFGFDCAHLDDYVPLMPEIIHGTYKDKEYVSKELDNLLHQLKSYVLIKE